VLRRRKPIFNDLLFRRREPVYVAFDVLNVEGADVRGMPLKDRRAILDRIIKQYRMQKAERAGPFGVPKDYGILKRPLFSLNLSEGTYVRRVFVCLRACSRCLRRSVPDPNTLSAQTAVL